jgi:hypothetical protein
MAFHGHQQLSRSIVEHVALAVDLAAAAWPEHTEHLSKVLIAALAQREFSDPEYAKAAVGIIQVLNSPALLHFLGLELRRRSITAERQVPARFESLVPVLAALPVRMAQFVDEMADPTKVPVGALGSALRMVFMIGELPDMQTRRDVLQRRWAAATAEVAGFLRASFADVGDGTQSVQPLFDLDELFEFSTLVEIGGAADPMSSDRFDQLKENLEVGKRGRGVKA